MLVELVCLIVCPQGPFRLSCKLSLATISPVLSGVYPTIRPWISEDGFSHATCSIQYMKTMLLFESSHCWTAGNNQSNSSFTCHWMFACQNLKRGYSKLHAWVNELCNITNILWLCLLKQTIDLIRKLLAQVAFFLVNPFSDLDCACCHNEWTRAVWEKMWVRQIEGTFRNHIQTQLWMMLHRIWMVQIAV